MIILFKKENSNFSEGQLMPLIELPIGQEGEELELNDFQWWAPTDKWEAWLKANPREWKAESEDPIYKKSDEEIFEFLTSEGIVDPSVVGFEEFSKLMEEDEGVSSSATEADSGRFTKFHFAYNKLLEEGKISSEISLASLTPNEEYALILDHSGEDGNPVESTRNAFKFKVLPSGENSKLIMGEISGSLIGGPFEEGQTLPQEFAKIGNIIGGLTSRGVFTFGSIALVIKTMRGTVGLLGRSKWLSALTGIRNLNRTGKAKTGWNIFKNIRTLGGATTFLSAAAKKLAGGAGLKGALKSLKSLKNIRSAVRAGRAATSAAKVSNPLGWIITAVTSAQQLYNWQSDDQAPRLGQIEDEGIDAHNSFTPSEIPDGSEITVCWTQEAGQTSISKALLSMVVANDTRTTMNLLKIGNFKGESLFYLISIHSELYAQVLKENPNIFISFPESKTFLGSGYASTVADNDDLTGKIIILSGEGGAVAPFFQGYCGWSEIEKTFDESDDKFIGVTPNAPDEYSFHFKYGNSGKDVNVTGKLVKDLSDVDKVQATFVSQEIQESNSYPDDGVLSFSEFSSYHLNEGYLDYEILSEEDSSEDSSEEAAEGAKLTETEEIAAYEVSEIKFADSTFDGDPLPDLSSFIIPNSYLEAENNTPIEVNALQDVETRNARRGTITIEREIAEDPILAPTGGTEGESDENIIGGVPIEVTKDQVKIQHRDNPDFLNSIGISDYMKIKDKDKEDKIKLLDFITPEEKEQLGMEDWEFIKKVKIYKDGKTGDPYLIKFKSGGADTDRKRKINSSDPAFDTALKVAERIQAGFKPTDSKEDEED